MKPMRLCLLALVVASTAHAAPPKPDALVLPTTGLAKVTEGLKPPRVFAGLYGGTSVTPEPYDAADEGARLFDGKLVSKVVGFTSDRKAAWVAADVRLDTRCATGVKCTKQPPSFAHVTLIAEEGTPWQPALVHIGMQATEKEAAANGAPDAIARKVDAGAEDVVKLFESTIGDPAALAGSVSTRKEAVLFGSRKPERYVGSAAMKATLKKWGLAFKVRDGVQAGVTQAKNLAWVAANVDATSAKKPDAKPTPYRATFVYEQTPKGWQLVVAQFSVFQPTI